MPEKGDGVDGGLMLMNMVYEMVVVDQDPQLGGNLWSLVSRK